MVKLVGEGTVGCVSERDVCHCGQAIVRQHESCPWRHEGTGSLWCAGMSGERPQAAPRGETRAMGLDPGIARRKSGELDGLT